MTASFPGVSAFNQVSEAPKQVAFWGLAWWSVYWLRHHPQDLGLIPGQGTGSYMLQKRVHLPKLKISRAITKISHIQINIGEIMVLSWKIKK